LNISRGQQTSVPTWINIFDPANQDFRTIQFTIQFVVAAHAVAGG
jgi:hypothetical protein